MSGNKPLAVRRAVVQSGGISRRQSEILDEDLCGLLCERGHWRVRVSQ